VRQARALARELCADTALATCERDLVVLLVS